MRDDMFKVIVERPRRGGWMNAGTARAYRNSEDAPAKVGIKKGYTHRKWLNENLAPLKRWLESQVNRPWDKVYAELCANIDRRNTVQEHIFAHIDSFVERETRLVDGKVYVTDKWPPKLVPIEESRATLYVHPATGILRINKYRETWRQARDKQRAKIEADFAAKQRNISETEQLHKVDGVWYLVTFATMDAPYRADARDGESSKLVYPQHWDVLQKATVSRWHREIDGRPISKPTCENPFVYASEKRQLSNAELRRHQLTNETNAGNSRRFRFHVWKNFRVCFSQHPLIAALTIALSRIEFISTVIAIHTSRQPLPTNLNDSHAYTPNLLALASKTLWLGRNVYLSSHGR